MTSNSVRLIRLHTNIQMPKSHLFFLFGFNTKIQRYHTSSSQISSFTLEPKLEEKGEEKRLSGGKKLGETEKVKQIPGAHTFNL